jgi:hypothetical protein
VRVEAEQDASGNRTAKEIDRKNRPWRPLSSVQYKLSGPVEAMTGDTWKVAGTEFTVTPRTSMEDSVFVGARVKVDTSGNHDSYLSLVV